MQGPFGSSIKFNQVQSCSIELNQAKSSSIKFNQVQSSSIKFNQVKCIGLSHCLFVSLDFISVIRFWTSLAVIRVATTASFPQSSDQSARTRQTQRNR